MDKEIYVSLLFDFYGELLTEKQREYIDLYYNDNLSLSEIAENDGISRQGVRDVLVRAEASLLETEKKTGFAARHAALRRQIDEAQAYVTALEALHVSENERASHLELCRALKNKLAEMRL